MLHVAQRARKTSAVTEGKVSDGREEIMDD
jgi:hypothetical protein